MNVLEITNSVEFGILKPIRKVAESGYSFIWTCQNFIHSETETPSWKILKVSKTSVTNSTKQNNFRNATVREISAYEKLKTSPWTVQYYGCISVLYNHEPTTALILECFQPSFTLRKWMAKTFQNTPEEILHVFSSLVRALQYCHLHQIVHHDCKPDNILLSNNGNHQTPTVKLIDFGLAQPYSEEFECCVCGGTPAYAAPEILTGKKHSSAYIDHWSAGVILFELCTGHSMITTSVTLREHKMQMLQFDVIDRLHHCREPHWNLYEESFRDFAKTTFTGLLDTNPQKRPRWEDVLSTISDISLPHLEEHLVAP